MSKFANYQRRYLPGPISYALTWAQLHLFPSEFYRRQSSVISKFDITKVAAGPFAGMDYGPIAADKGLLPRLLGSYEKETYPSVERIIAASPDLVVVAGSGEGYFAVGIASRLPAAKVVAFELSAWGRYLTARHAVRNNVQVQIHGLCTTGTLAAALDGHRCAAVVCDIEGGEREVLDPVAVPALTRATILVELHPMYVDGIEETVTGRFSSTHDITVMRLGERSIEDVPVDLRDRLPVEDCEWAVNEVQFRGTGLWLFLNPK